MNAEHINDQFWMAQAMELAWQGQFTTTPNPRVGCVMVRDNRIIAGGYHQRAGYGHAEVEAIAQARSWGVDLEGATAYVNLEPCVHQGRTGPCTDALIKAKVTRVVAAVLDPNPLVAGKGISALQAAGISTQVGVLTEQASWINRGFFSRMQRRRPWLRLKVASSVDGTTALGNQVSQWITGPLARQDGHYARAQACAILTGIGTVKADNPQLNVRGVPTERQPIKVIVDSFLEISPQATLLQSGRTWIAHSNQPIPSWWAKHPNRDQIEFIDASSLSEPSEKTGIPRAKTDLHQLMSILAERGIQEVHAEAGYGLNGSLLQAGLVDEILQYVAPRFLGPGLGLARLPELTAIPAGVEWKLHTHTSIGDDLKLVWIRKNRGAFGCNTSANAT